MRVSIAIATVKGKIKFTLEQATKAQSGIDVYLYSFFNLSAKWEWVVNAMPRPLYPRERPGALSIRGWVAPRAGLGVRKISPPPGFDPRTVQPVANSHSTHIIVLIVAVSYFNTLQV